MIDTAVNYRPAALDGPTTSGVNRALDSAPLVHFGGSWANDGSAFSYSTVAGRTPDRGAPGHAPFRTSGPRLQPAGTSFGTAVEAAIRAARHPIALDGSNAALGTFRAAHAVLQASDGAWYVTALREARGTHRWLPLGNDPRETDDPNARMRSLRLTPLDPAVKAVVGAYSWVNFTDEPLEPAFGVHREA